MTDNFFEQSPELRAISMMLDKLEVPEHVTYPYEYEGMSYPVKIERMGLNPAAALQVFRNFGFMGIQHSAPTVYFWNAVGAPQEVCADFKAKVGDGIFDIIAAQMKSPTHRPH